jgi:uncharacterized membrane protein YuzA (DUF378 family)
MKVRNVAIVAGGTSTFGVGQATYRDLISEAGKSAFESAPAQTSKDIEGFLLSTVMPERFVFQTHVAPLAADTLGVWPSKLIARVELLCGSGSSATRLAYGFIAAGLAEVIMVVGAEKMYTPNPLETVHQTLAAGDVNLPTLGQLFSYTMQVAGVSPVFESPLFLDAVEFENGMRILAKLVETTEDDLDIGREEEMTVLEVPRRVTPQAPNPPNRVMPAIRPVMNN